MSKIEVWKDNQFIVFGTEDGFVGVYRVITGKIVFLKRLFDSVEEERGCDVDGDGNGGGGKRLHCSFRFHRSDSGLHVFIGEWVHCRCGGEMRPSHSYDAAIQLQPVICCSIRLGCLFDM